MACTIVAITALRVEQAVRHRQQAYAVHPVFCNLTTRRNFT